MNCSQPGRLLVKNWINSCFTSSEFSTIPAIVRNINKLRGCGIGRRWLSMTLRSQRQSALSLGRSRRPSGDFRPHFRGRSALFAAYHWTLWLNRVSGKMCRSSHSDRRVGLGNHGFRGPKQPYRSLVAVAHPRTGVNHHRNSHEPVWRLVAGYAGSQAATLLKNYRRCR